MKDNIKRGRLSKRKFGSIFLGAAAISAAMLSSCTIDEVLDGADSALRDHYASEFGVTLAPTTTPEPTTMPEPTTTPEPTTSPEPIVVPSEIKFSMPFIDKAHGGVDYKITQSFSSRHGGLDIGVYWGDPIIAATSGIVVLAYNEGDISSSSSNLSWTYGTFVVIESDGGEYRTYYAHMSKKTVNVGDRVSLGDIIGYSGNTGRVSSSSSGPYAGTHLHFEIRKLIGSAYVRTDPKQYLPWWS